MKKEKDSPTSVTVTVGAGGAEMVEVKKWAGSVSVVVVLSGSGARASMGARRASRALRSRMRCSASRGTARGFTRGGERERVAEAASWTMRARTGLVGMMCGAGSMVVARVGRVQLAVVVMSEGTAETRVVTTVWVTR